MILKVYKYTILTLHSKDEDQDFLRFNGKPTYKNI